VQGNVYEQGFDLKLWPERLSWPLTWKKPQMIFVNSMSDLFHKDIPDEYIQQVFAIMNKAQHHTFQVLTKRPSRAALIAHKLTWTPNIWLGTSIERNDYIWRAEKLRLVPAAIRFISAEPLLGELTNLDLTGIDWLITGAESGRGARPMDENWVRFLRDRCVASDTAFFYKQKLVRGKKFPLPELDGCTWQEYPQDLYARSPLVRLVIESAAQLEKCHPWYGRSFYYCAYMDWLYAAFAIEDQDNDTFRTCMNIIDALIPPDTTNAEDEEVCSDTLQLPGLPDRPEYVGHDEAQTDQELRQVFRRRHKIMRDMLKKLVKSE
jgi:protein gp37